MHYDFVQGGNGMKFFLRGRERGKGGERQRGRETEEEFGWDGMRR